MLIAAIFVTIQQDTKHEERIDQKCPEEIKTLAFSAILCT